MHPNLWHAARAHFKCGGFYAMRPGCGPGGNPWGGSEEDGFDGGGGFGVRRPLRFLAHQLGLDEGQIAVLARILDELKTERAQAAVDQRRTVAAFADALSADVYDAAKAAEGGDLRLASTQRLRDAILKALQQIHALLNRNQRERFAYLIRTGRLTL